MRASSILPVLLLLFPFLSSAAIVSKCHSCFAACDNVDDCDCTSTTDSDTCHGDYCYVKIDRLSQSGLGSIRKGCSDWAPDQYVDACQYVGDNSTVECYCRGGAADDPSSCNTASHFENYRVRSLPLVSCCECSGFDYENGTIDCLADECLKNCTGNYCYNDIVRRSQGCGWGHALSWQFLRNAHRTDHPRPSNSTASLPLPWSMDGGDMTCTEAYADLKTIVRGCTCAYDSCNLETTASFYVRNETEERPAIEDYCYAVHATAGRPLTADVFRDSTTCPGHFCFLTYTTQVLAYRTEEPTTAGGVNGSLWDIGGRARINRTITDEDSSPHMSPWYELSAGCMLVDDESKVATGCTTEWSRTPDQPSKKHCVCKGHMCNYFNLITGEDQTDFLAFDWITSKDYKTISSSAHHERPMVTGYLLWMLLGLVVALRQFR